MKSTATADTNWQAEEDLRTLARAEEIKKDKKRYAAALVLAVTRIEELQDLQEDVSEDDGEEAKEKK